NFNMQLQRVAVGRAENSRIEVQTVNCADGSRKSFGEGRALRVAPNVESGRVRWAGRSFTRGVGHVAGPANIPAGDRMWGIKRTGLEISINQEARGRGGNGDNRYGVEQSIGRGVPQSVIGKL